MKGILTALGLYVALTRFSDMMLTEERNLPLCARMFRWVLYLCLVVVSLSVAIATAVFLLGYSANCLMAWGLI